MKTPLLAASLLLAAGLAWAHKVPSSFPAGARAPTAIEPRGAVEGKVYTAQPVGGPAWELRYDAGGRFSVSAGPSSDDGQWSTQDGAVCTAGQKLKYLCNEIRMKDGALFLKRKEGEVMRLTPR